MVLCSMTLLALFQFSILLLSVIYIRQTLGEGRIQLRLVQYVNSNGRANNNHCCDGRSFFCESNGGCDHFFKVCIDSFDGSDSMERCSIGLRATPTTSSGLLTIDFSQEYQNSENVIDIAFTSLEEGVLIKIEVWDDDYGKNADDFVDFLKQRLALNPSPSEQLAEWQDVTLTSRTVMTAQVRAYCDANWYGESCDTYCLPQNSKTGHYNCSSTGQKICHTGWTGHRCGIMVDHCSSAPCRHGGTCENHFSAYTCTCPAGFTGADCELNIDDCAGVTCKGAHSTCVDLINGYRCDCPYSRTGIHCEVMLNPCEASPCRNGATCLNTSSSRVDNNNKMIQGPGVESQPGSLLIPHTEDETDNSKESEINSFDFESQEPVPYPPPYFPDERPDDEWTLEAGYECRCEAGWTGRDCDQTLSPCDNSPCDQGSTCLVQEGAFKCLCPPGKTGLDCSENPCSSNPCLNKGVCIVTHNAQTTSEETTEAATTALHSTTQDHVQANATVDRTTIYSTISVDETYSITTIQAVTSRLADQGDFHCSCESGYTGRYCEIERDSEEGKRERKFLPLDRVKQGDSSSLLFEGRLDTKSVIKLKKVLVKWGKCYLEEEMKGSSENKTMADCLSRTSPALLGGLSISYQALECRTSERNHLTAFTFQFLSGKQIISFQTTETILDGIPESEFPASVHRSQSNDDVECVVAGEALAQTYKSDGEGSKLYLIIIVAGVALVVCAAIIAVVVAYKIKRKVITKEVLVPAYNNPLYCSSTLHGDAPSLLPSEEQAQLIPDSTVSNPANVC